ncbi:hypothetical protein AAVH_30087, partial [Aphelenchoides avenae]
YIIVNAVCGASLEVCLMATHLEPLFPAPIMIIGGMLRPFVLPDWTYFIGVNAFAICIAGEISTILAMFICRYCQSASGDVLLGLLRAKQLLVSCVLLIVIVDLVAIGGINMIMMSPESTRTLLEEHRPDLFELVYNRTVISFR